MSIDAETIAEYFHEAYERLAPEYGYETRADSAVPWEWVPNNNKRLMVAAVCEALTRGESTDVADQFSLMAAVERCDEIIAAVREAQMGYVRSLCRLANHLRADIETIKIVVEP